MYPFNKRNSISLCLGLIFKVGNIEVKPQDSVVRIAEQVDSTSEKSADILSTSEIFRRVKALHGKRNLEQHSASEMMFEPEESNHHVTNNIHDDVMKMEDVTTTEDNNDNVPEVEINEVLMVVEAAEPAEIEASNVEVTEVERKGDSEAARMEENINTTGGLGATYEPSIFMNAEVSTSTNATYSLDSCTLQAAIEASVENNCSYFGQKAQIK